MWSSVTPAYTTRCELVGTDPADRALVDRFRALLGAWGAVASFHDPHSELSQLNADPAPEVRVSARLAHLLEVTDEAVRASGGVIDPVRAADPSALEPDHPVARLGRRSSATWDDVERDDDVVRRPPGTLIDLGGLAKAAIADAIALELAADAVGAILVNLGGDLRCVGEAPWSILVTDDGSLRPDAPGQRIHIPAGAVATSDRASRRTPRGLDHIVGASTLPGAARRATVVAESAVAANAASLAIIAAGRAWHRMWRRFELPALVVTNAGERLPLGGWPPRLEEAAAC